MKRILTSQKIRNALAVAFYCTTAFFLYIYVRRLDTSKLESIDIQWMYMIVALPFSILSRIFLPYIWIRLIRIYQDMPTKNDYLSLNYIYAKTWLGKYIPGNVAYIAGKIYFAAEKGINKTVLGITAVLEILLQLLTALLLGVIFLFVSGNYANFSLSYNLFFFISTIVGIGILYPPVFNRALSKGYRFLKKKKLQSSYYVSANDIVRNGSLYMVVHSLSAFPIFFFTKALGYDISVIESIYVSGAFIFAGAIGTMAIFVPSGLGVREAILLLFLGNILPVEINIVLVIALRLWSVVLDLVYWLLSRLALGTNTQKSKEIDES